MPLRRYLRRITPQGRLVGADCAADAGDEYNEGSSDDADDVVPQRPCCANRRTAPLYLVDWPLRRHCPALAARAGGSGTLMAILSFPLVIPLLFLLVNAGGHAVGLESGTERTYLLLTGAIDLIALSVGLLLFPFVWRD